MIVRTNRAVFSSVSKEWATPKVFFQALDAEFNFTLDVCASPKNAKCDRFFDAPLNGLLQPWAPEVCWLNPPYGGGMDKWIRKAFEESRRGATVVCLVPARTDTIWWHEYALKAEEIRFIKGRLRFDDGTGRATFPSVLIIFRGHRSEER